MVQIKQENRNRKEESKQSGDKRERNCVEKTTTDKRTLWNLEKHESRGKLLTIIEKL